MRRPRVSSPWHTKRAPPSSSTIAMCSGERKPSGAECSVVNETISPTPGTVVGVIATGCHGQYVAGGATTAWHRGQREAAISAMVATGGPARSVGGLFEKGGGCAPRRWSSYGFQQCHPVVRREAADGVGEGDASGHLAGAHAAGELPHALDELRDAGRGQRMPAGLEAAGRVDRQAAVARGLAVEGDPAGLPRRDEAEILERDQLERREGVVQLREVDALRTEARHLERRSRRHAIGLEARERVAM